MRSILITVLLLIVTLTLYISIADSPGGTRDRLANSAEAMSESIRRLSP